MQSQEVLSPSDKRELHNYLDEHDLDISEEAREQLERVENDRYFVEGDIHGLDGVEVIDTQSLVRGQFSSLERAVEAILKVEDGYEGRYGGMTTESEDGVETIKIWDRYGTGKEWIKMDSRHAIDFGDL